jgi:cysteine desulfurase
MSSALAEFGNPSSVHSFGRAARRVVEDARRKVAALVAARPDDVVFTSGGTEANNLALRGSGRRRTLATAIEHPSVLEAADGIESVPVDGNGIVDLEALARTLEGADTPAIVSVMLANNETGVVLPVAEAARIAHRNGALFHCDAVQAAGRIALSMEALGADMLTLSAHKMGGPKGVGALIVSDRVQLHPIICGGGQERGRRSGTENLPGIAGFGAAAEVAAAGESTRRGRWPAFATGSRT